MNAWSGGALCGDLWLPGAFPGDVQLPAEDMVLLERNIVQLGLQWEGLILLFPTCSRERGFGKRHSVHWTCVKAVADLDTAVFDRNVGFRHGIVWRGACDDREPFDRSIGRTNGDFSPVGDKMVLRLGVARRLHGVVGFFFRCIETEDRERAVRARL